MCVSTHRVSSSPPHQVSACGHPSYPDVGVPTIPCPHPWGAQVAVCKDMCSVSRLNFLKDTTTFVTRGGRLVSFPVSPSRFWWG